MSKYKMVLQYDGSRYDGWQKQNNTPHSVQGVLETLLSCQFGQAIHIHGSGRTDKGVHALGQVAHLQLPDEQTPEQMETTIRQVLPADIGLISLTPAASDFHCRYDAKSKIYEYRLRTGVRQVFSRKYEYLLEAELDVEKMKMAAAYLIGRHDFTSFTTDKRTGKNMVRKIRTIDITEKQGLCTLRFAGDGFLYNMVRILTGTLIEVGRGDRPPADIKAILAARDRCQAGFTAPPSGLFLVQVIYSESGN